jgi:3'-5' exonuclease
MQHTIFIDIETLPGESRPDPETLIPPGNYKSPETIAKWRAENADKVYRAQALDSMAGRILCIGYAIDDTEPVALTVGLNCQTEAEALEKLEESIDPLGLPVTWAGHNVRNFDLQWLWRKALQYDCARLAQAIPRERYSKNVIDSMELWAGPDYQARASLDAIGRFLGIGRKTEGIDGSKVFDFWQEGRLEEISSYCKQDVVLARSIINILTGGL